MNTFSDPSPHSHRFVSLRTLAAVALLAACATQSFGMTLRELRTLEKTEKQGANYANYYLVGVVEGVLEASAQAVRLGAQPSVCLKGRRLEPHMVRSLYDTELKRNEGVYEADMPVQLVVANALGTVYPC